MHHEKLSTTSQEQSTEIHAITALALKEVRQEPTMHETTMHCGEHVQTINGVTVRGRRIKRHWQGHILRIRENGLGEEIIDVVGDEDAILFPFRLEELEPYAKSE